MIQAVEVTTEATLLVSTNIRRRLLLIANNSDTVTMYVGPARQQDLVEPIIALAPKRVIFNPGTENPVAYAQLQAAGIEVIEACTLVMLRTRQF